MFSFFNNYYKYWKYIVISHFMENFRLEKPNKYWNILLNKKTIIEITNILRKLLNLLTTNFCQQYFIFQKSISTCQNVQ